MKRYFICVCLVLVLVVLSCGCTLVNNTNSNNDAIYDKLDSLVKYDYNALTLKSSMESNGKTLVGNYSITKNGDKITAEYSYQQFATFKEVDGELVAPENEIETKSGSVTSQNGQVIDEKGDVLNISIDTVSAKGFSFEKSNFKDVTSGSNRFTATVASPKAFIGIENATDMTVVVDFTANYITKIVVKYTVDERDFELSYEF